ncbi:uncharacterized protein LOC133202218 isoform X3 [Saccostrea echinata]|uniref:uncharacterized protein LOC133202218 isoform X3 n=1 Tax=Saccostrea echinata TaxID=191078 RepID=UPI002A7F455F|nr:uncharacterized protein LOC133202218 isoform X3 [Saccostrea echinata]
MGTWSNGLCGCFNNCMLCLTAYFAPCYVVGKNAEAVGESMPAASIAYLLFPPVGIFLAAKTREKIRQQKGIEGSFGGDCLVHLFCPLCALIQDAQEIQPQAQAQSMARE